MSESKNNIKTLNQVHENGVESFLGNASDECYDILNTLIREQHPETVKRVQLFNIRKNFLGLHPGCGGMEPGVVKRQDGRVGLGYVRLNIQVPPKEIGFDTSVVIGS